MTSVEQMIAEYAALQELEQLVRKRTRYMALGQDIYNVLRRLDEIRSPGQDEPPAAAAVGPDGPVGSTHAVDAGAGVTTGGVVGEGTCMWCGETYEQHDDFRPPGAPVPRMPCTGLKSGFRARA